MECSPRKAEAFDSGNDRLEDELGNMLELVSSTPSCASVLLHYSSGSNGTSVCYAAGLWVRKSEQRQWQDSVDDVIYVIRMYNSWE